MKQNNLNFVFLVLLTLFKGVEGLFIGYIIGYIILAIVILCILICVIVCLCGGFAACISEATRSHTETRTVNTLATVQVLYPVTPQQSGSSPEGLPTVYLQSPQEAFEAACVLKITEPPTPTAPPLRGEPPPPYPGVDAPPPYSIK